MPAFVDTPEKEKKWKRAKQAVMKLRHKKKKDMQSRDWGLVTHIFQGMKKAMSKDQKYVVYRAGLNHKKIKLAEHDDPAKAKDQVKNLKRLYKEHIDVAIEKKPIEKSIKLCKSVLKERKCR